MHLLNPSAPRIRAEPPKSPAATGGPLGPTTEPATRVTGTGKGERSGVTLSPQMSARRACPVPGAVDLQQFIVASRAALFGPAGVSPLVSEQHTGRIKDPLAFPLGHVCLFFLFVFLHIFELEGDTEIIAKRK